ncbi:MAG: hypothetical protein ACPGYV_09220 [Phycisphaeraceae bacterium]
MLKLKWVQVAAIGLAAVGFGVAPAGDADAGSCGNDRWSQDRWHGSHHRASHDGWHRNSRGGHYAHRGHVQRGYHHNGYDSRARISYRNDNVRFSVNVGSHRSYGHQPTVHRNTHVQRTTVYHSNPRSGGYWSRVYRPPVYETRYRRCGTPYRVCVRAGYYERVWVSTGVYCR